MRTSFCAASALTIALAASDAVAQDASRSAAAEQLYEEGKRLVSEQRYAEACPKLAESLRLDPGIGIRLHLASCYEKLGRTASAWAQFREAEQIATRDGDARAAVARKRASALEPMLFRVTIAVPADAEVTDLEVRCDGAVVGRAQWGVAVPLDPGEHPIVVSAPRKLAWSTDVHVPATGGAATVTVPALVDVPAPVPSPSPAPAPATAPATSRAPASAPAPAPSLAPASARRTVALSVAGAGVVALGVGAYFTIDAKRKLDDSNQNGCAPNNHCTASGATIRDSARTAGDIATVSTIVGLAALATGGVLYVTASPPRRTGVRVVPTGGLRAGGLSLEGTW